MIATQQLQRANVRRSLLLILISIAGLCVIVGVRWLALPRTPEGILDAHARTYVLLALGLDEQKEGEVDAWLGPPELVETARKNAYSLDELLLRTQTLEETVAKTELRELESRRQGLLEKIAHLKTVLELVTARAELPFATELEKLYGVSMPPPADSDWQGRRDALEALLPGTGTLAFRLASFHNKLIIPPDKRRAVFEAALAECRQRTLKHWKLPDDEVLAVEWTRDVSAAWHKYLGDRRSTLRLNELTVAVVSQAVELACHEAYPGHHAQFLLMDGDTDERLLPEDSIVLLRSPGSILREGAASFGVELAFTPQERLAFERDVLFPIAGLPAEQAETSFRVHELVTELSSAAVEVIRDYYDGDADYNTTSFRLERDAMIASPLPLLEFVDTYGTYSMGYTLLRDVIRTHADALDDIDRWSLLERLITQPATESIMQLQVDGDSAN